MVTKSVLFFTLIALLASPALALDEVGSFAMTNSLGINVDVQCAAYSGQTELSNMGDFNLVNRLTWTNFVEDTTTSVRCAFKFSLLGGNFGQYQPTWVRNDPRYTLPVECNDCDWIVSSTGLSLLNPSNGQYIDVAGWISE